MTEPIICLSRADIESLLTFDAVLPLIEAGFSQHAAGRAVTFPTVRVGLTKTEGIFGVKSGFLDYSDTLGLKAGGYWGQRVKSGRPGHHSTIVLFDPGDGRPVALMDGNYITEVRTAAASAVGARALARADAGPLRVGLIGAGVQARVQMQGLGRVLNVGAVRCYDANPEAAHRLAGLLTEQGLAASSVAAPEDAVVDMHVVLTTTPSRQPIVRDEWVGPGTHINAMGADTRGKQELETALLKRALVVVDDRAQAAELGEWQHVAAGPEGEAYSIYAELGEITAGRKPGRTSPEQITVFDGTGVSFQDLVTAQLALDLARANGVGQLVYL